MRRHLRPRHVWPLPVALAALVAAGCAASSGQGPSAASPGPSGTATASPTASAAPRAAGTGPATSSPASTSCATQSWGTGPKGGSTAMSPAPLYLVRVGQHPCYDRVVFDVNGPAAVGYVVRYVPVVTADASGKPVPVAGRAALEVVVRAPIYGTDNQGHQPSRKPPTVGDDLVAPRRVAGWSSLREVKFAGSFEGQTTLAVGVRTRLPFRASVSGDTGYRHLILDIAH